MGPWRGPERLLKSDESYDQITKLRWQYELTMKVDRFSCAEYNGGCNFGPNSGTKD